MKSGSLYGPRCQGSYCCGVRVRPEVWLASSASVTLRMSPPCCSSVTYLSTGSSSATSPCFTACASKVDMNTLVTEAEIEQHIRGDRLLARDVGHAVVEEQGAVVDMDHDRHAAGGNEHRLHVLADDLPHLGIVGACGRGRGYHRGGERCRRHRRRHHPHRSLPSAGPNGPPTERGMDRFA